MYIVLILYLICVHIRKLAKRTTLRSSSECRQTECETNEITV